MEVPPRPKFQVPPILANTHEGCKMLTYVDISLCVARYWQVLNLSPALNLTGREFLRVETQVRKGSPCKSSSEFLGEALVWSYCDLWDLKPSKDLCAATPGCCSATRKRSCWCSQQRYGGTLLDWDSSSETTITVEPYHCWISAGALKEPYAQCQHVEVLLHSALNDHQP